MSNSIARPALVLGLLSCIGPFAIDMYLPALPEIGHSLSADIAQVQLSLTVFFLALGLCQRAAQLLGEQQAVGQLGQHVVLGQVFQFGAVALQVRELPGDLVLHLLEAVRQRADLVLLHHKDERALAYELGGNPVATACGLATLREQHPGQHACEHRRHAHVERVDAG